ncbi:MBOAT family protein, partial [Opisthorchis viverrini]
IITLGYPISIVYSLLSGKWSVPQRQLFLLLCGVFLFSWNFGKFSDLGEFHFVSTGLDIIHMFIGIFVTMFVNYMCFRTKLSVIFAFVFNMAYLLSGSYIYNRGTYDINWTTPYCILCLRLIGLTWDLFDASKPESERSAYQKQSALQTFPGVLETLSFCFVPTAFISGPQFPMRHYQSFVDGSLRPTAILANRSFTQRFIFNVKVQRTVIRFTMGLLAVERTFAVSVHGCVRANHAVSEGACVLLGLGCTGLVHFKYLEDTDKKSRSPQFAGDVPEVRTKSALERRDSAVPWSDLAVKLNSYDPKKLDVREADHTACANISLGNLLLATNSDHLVAGFNINTNKWMLEYVYKRLRFLGNKQLSQLCTLTFLALWHGTYTGYFVNFALEFIIIAVERDFILIVKRSKFGDFLYKTTPGFVLTSVTGKLHVLFMLATPLTAFYLLQYHLWFPVLKSTYFIGFIYVLWPLLRPIVKRMFPRKVNGSQSNGGATPQSDDDKSKTQ